MKQPPLAGQRSGMVAPLAPYRPSRRSGWQSAAAVLVVVGVLLAAAISGALVAVGGALAAAAVASVVVLGAALLIPVTLLFNLFVGLVFVVVGQLQYFAHIDKVFWVPYLLALLLYLRMILVAPARTLQLRQPAKLTPSLRLAMVMFAMFLATAVASSLISGVPLLQWVVAGKEYFFLWSVLLGFLVGALGLQHIERLVGWIPWFLALQVPVVLYQRFVVAAKRVGGSPWDAVVGLFGGNPQAGGASGTMAIFSLIAMALMIEGWQAGRVSARRALLTCAFALTACALAEVKLVIVALPLLLLLVFGAELMRRPMVGLAGLLVGTLLTVGMLTLYQRQFTSERTQEGKSLQAYVETIVRRNSDERALGAGFGEMGRAAAIRFWWREQSATDAATALVGHGVGSSRIGGLVVGDLVKRYQMRIARSSLAVYLWETGLLGAGSLIAGFLLAIAAARRLARLPALKTHAWLLRGAALGLGLVLVTLPYGPDFVEVAQLQVVAFILMGTVISAARQRHQASSAP